jgi:hypothetical protein
MAKIKVSQKTIDQIKNLGMTKALAAGKTVKSAQFQEGLRRMYGAARVNKALGRSTTPTSRADRMSRPKKVARTADRMSTNPKRVSRTADRMTTNPKRVSRTANRTAARKTTTAPTTRSQAVAAGPRAMAAYNARPKTAKKKSKSKFLENLGAGLSTPRDYKKK